MKTINKIKKFYNKNITAITATFHVALYAAVLYAIMLLISNA